MKSFRLEMLRAARLGRNRLPDSAQPLRQFLTGQRDSGGGFVNRQGRSDLYYTAFGLMCWIALDGAIDEPLRQYVLAADPAQLDLVHLSCWARSAALLAETGGDKLRTAAISRVTELNVLTPSPSFSPYDAFLAVGIYQDMAQEPRAERNLAEGVMAALDACRCRGGGYGGKGLKLPLVSLASAALVVQWALDQPLDPTDVAWLTDQCRSGGFASSPLAKGPDLLSTAVALLALSCSGADLSAIVHDCRGYVLGLYDGASCPSKNVARASRPWSEDAKMAEILMGETPMLRRQALFQRAASFHPTADDPHSDCEYSLYGMMALGICDGIA